MKAIRLEHPSRLETMRLIDLPDPGEPGPGEIRVRLREVAVVPATAFTRAPRGYSHAEAATLTIAGRTAWRALAVNGGLKAGDTVLTLGAGGVSIFAVQGDQRQR